MAMFATSPTLQAGFTAVQQHPDLADREGSHHALEQTLLCHPQSHPGEVRADSTSVLPPVCVGCQHMDFLCLPLCLSLVIADVNKTFHPSCLWKMWMN